MAGFDHTISNGTCYTGQGNRAGKSFIPCGNAYSEDIFLSCCGIGDWCYAPAGLCHQKDRTNGAFYIAGCTDSEYKNSLACPNKGQYSTQKWVGVIPCGPSQDGAGVNWAGCTEPEDDQVTTFNSSCLCDNNPPILKYPVGLVPTASLPDHLGGGIGFAPGYPSTTNAVIPIHSTTTAVVPTVTTSSNTTSTDTTSTDTTSTDTTSVDTTSAETTSTHRTSKHATSTATTPTVATSTDVTPTGHSTISPTDTATTVPLIPATSANNNPLSKADIVGMSVGIVGFAVIVFASIAYLIIRRRRKRAEDQELMDGTQESHQLREMDPTGTAVAPVSAMDAPPPAFRQPILRARQRQEESTTEDAHQTGLVMPPVSPTPPTSPTAQLLDHQPLASSGSQQFKAYSPAHWSDGYSSSHYSTDSVRSPRQNPVYGSPVATSTQHTGSVYSPENAGREQTNQQNMASIAELEGSGGFAPHERI
ncbi:hypothetical protein E8E14_002160 [Neopestalotiopsis sp. 37M]|nr:hypothetical protein E8E14_002160 [Neopestalotiopsis sp. 37M]